MRDPTTQQVAPPEAADNGPVIDIPADLASLDNPGAGQGGGSGPEAPASGPVAASRAAEQGDPAVVELGSELGAVLDSNKPNVAAVVLNNLAGKSGEASTGPAGQEQSQAPAPVASVAAEPDEAAVVAENLSIQQRLGRAMVWISDSLSSAARSAREALTPSAKTKRKAADTAKFLGGTVTPQVTGKGSALASVGMTAAKWGSAMVAKVKGALHSDGWQAAQQKAQTIAHQAALASQILNPISLATSILTFCLDVRAIISSARHLVQLQKLARDAIARAGSAAGFLAKRRLTVGKALTYAANQKKRKIAKRSVSAIAGGLSVSSAAIGTLAAFGVIAATPVGWILGGIGAALGLGLLAYKIYRKNKDKKAKAGALGLTRENAASILYSEIVRDDPDPAAVRAVTQELKIPLHLAKGSGGKALIFAKLKS